MNHYNSMKKLFPLSVGGVFDVHLEIKGHHLDSALAIVESIAAEASPSTAVHTLDRWEREYGILSDSGVDTSVRRGIIKSRMREKSSSNRGSLSRDIFIRIADALGYTITIEESAELFRAGISRAGDMVFAAGQLWVWTVVVHGYLSAPDLEAVLSDIAPPYSLLQFRFEQ
jgi:uncharacterized protein YmfQ (DUF2313 family)